jgi:hypothetical protein
MHVYWDAGARRRRGLVTHPPVLGCVFSVVIKKLLINIINYYEKFSKY